MTGPVRHSFDDPQLADILSLLHDAFAYMDGRIDPPSSLQRLTLEDVRAHCETGEVWSIGSPPKACMFLSPRPDALYLGKLAVAPEHQGKGLARQLVDCAEARCVDLGLQRLELKTRVELVANHLAFTRMGFVVTGRTAHPGYDRPTSLTFTKLVTR
ncbi:GNAT family N-acetyltransferase [Sulfitobacter sp. D35]|uniref:GNAT family N-acetyltransferase n=1 Tax=Sulfitobacter sp. D35 TaxID=3083252 RepID=UPI00296FB584|nr:GNAT family N-acetyltransferase [Sulfitobacter sp. D35]MDW4500096.1 GNAT family N-acetyltransferase [Sulfitobacter sp. D35]